MGVGSEVWSAVTKGRKGNGAELKASYFRQAVRNLAAAKFGRTSRRQCRRTFSRQPSRRRSPPDAHPRLRSSIARTGWCLFEPPSHSSILSDLSLLARQHTCRPRRRPRSFATRSRMLFRAHKPQFVIWEAAAEVIRSFVKQGREDLVGPTKAPPMTVNADQLILRDIRVISAMPLGPGASPMSRCSRRHGARRSLKNGNLGREDAKRKAKESCQMLRIPGEERTIRPRLVQSRSMGRRRRRIG